RRRAEDEDPDLSEKAEVGSGLSACRRPFGRRRGRPRQLFRCCLMNGDAARNGCGRPEGLTPRGCSLLALIWLCLAGCNRYSDFSLPTPASAQAHAASFDWKADSSPVLSPGDWDSVDVLNPSVLRRDRTYYNLYSGFDGRT